VFSLSALFPTASGASPPPSRGSHVLRSALGTAYRTISDFVLFRVEGSGSASAKVHVHCEDRSRLLRGKDKGPISYDKAVQREAKNMRAARRRAALRHEAVGNKATARTPRAQPIKNTQPDAQPFIKSLRLTCRQALMAPEIYASIVAKQQTAECRDRDRSASGMTSSSRSAFQGERDRNFWARGRGMLKQKILTDPKKFLGSPNLFQNGPMGSTRDLGAINACRLTRLSTLALPLKF